MQNGSFSFFKYANREIFLKGYLESLDIDVEITSQEGMDAEFRFWPRYDDSTEPDLVIIVGKYYLLVEAKYFSDFGKESQNTDAQLVREIEKGKSEAKTCNKEFKLIAITADHVYKNEKFKTVSKEDLNYIKWTNWQQVSAFLDDVC